MEKKAKKKICLSEHTTFFGSRVTCERVQGHRGNHATFFGHSKVRAIDWKNHAKKSANQNDMY